MGNNIQPIKMATKNEATNWGEARFRFEGIGKTEEEALKQLSKRCTKHGFPAPLLHSETNEYYCGECESLGLLYKNKGQRLNTVFWSDRNGNVVASVYFH